EAAVVAATGARSLRAPRPNRSPSRLATSFYPDRFPWDPWRPDEAQRRLAGVTAPWYVAAGWAIELFLGGGHREHEDLEIAIPRETFDEVVEALSELEPYVITAPHEATPLDEARDRLEETHQSWLLDPDAGAWRIDVF